MKFEKFVKSLASSGVIYKRGVDDLPFADRWLASPSVFMKIPVTVKSDSCGHSGNAESNLQDD